MNWTDAPVITIFSFYIPPEARWLFLVTLVAFIIAIIWHAKRFHDGW